MPRDGSGNYTRPVNSVDPAVPTTTISSTDFNALTLDLATEMTDSLNRSGKGAMLAGINMSTNKIINLGVPSIASDAARLDTTATVLAASPTIVTPTITNPVVSTGIFATPAISNATMTGLTAIAGRVDGNSSASGNIGEILANTTSSAVANNTATSIATISVPAGIWLLIGGSSFTPSGGNSTSATNWIGPTINSPVLLVSKNDLYATLGNAFSITAGSAVIKQSGTTLWYVTAQANFGGSMSVSCSLTAVRIA